MHFALQVGILITTRPNTNQNRHVFMHSDYNVDKTLHHFPIILINQFTPNIYFKNLLIDHILGDLFEIFPPERGLRGSRPLLTKVMRLSCLHSKQL